MDLYKELTDGKGFAVSSIENIDLFKKLRNTFISKLDIPSESKKDINILRKTMANMSNAEINKSMVNLLTFTELSDMMVASCPDLIETLCGKKLFIQRRAHTIINAPGKDQRKQWAHYEMISGISPFSYVLWAPLHDLEDEGGTYYIDQNTSTKLMKKEEKEGLINGPATFNMMKNQKPAHLKFGQVLVFNPFVLHGNISFDSKFASIACNVRFQSYNRPLLQKNSDYLKYYELP